MRWHSRVDRAGNDWQSEVAVGVIGGSSGRPIPVNYLFALTICKGLSSPLHTRDGAPRLIQSTAIKPRSIDNKSSLWITSQGSQRGRQVNVLNRHEPPRVLRRLFGLRHAAMAGCPSMA